MLRLALATLALTLSTSALACGMYMPAEVRLAEAFQEIDAPATIPEAQRAPETISEVEVVVTEAPRGLLTPIAPELESVQRAVLSFVASVMGG